MKKSFNLLGAILIGVTGFGQLNVTFEKDTLVFERHKEIDQTVHLAVSINSFNTPGGAPNTITFAINPSPFTTMTNGDYVFSMAPITVVPGVTQIDCPVTIMHGENSSGDTLFVSIQMSYMNAVTQTKNIVLKIINKKAEEDDKKENKSEIYTTPFSKNKS